MRGQRHKVADLAAALHSGGDPVEPRSDCPATERMWDAVAGQLSTTERLAILDHTMECAACAEAWRLAIEFRSGESTSGIREAGHARVRLFSAALFKVASRAAAAIVIVAMGMLVAGRTDRKRIDSAVNDPARPNGSAERSTANAERSDLPGAPGNDVVTTRHDQSDDKGAREARGGQLSPADGHASRFAARQAARANAEIEGQIRVPNPSALDPAEMPGRSGPAPTVVPRDHRPGGTASGRNAGSKATGGSTVSVAASRDASFDLKFRLQVIAVREFVDAIDRQDEQTMRRLFPTSPGAEARPRMTVVGVEIEATQASVRCHVFQMVTTSDGVRTESKVPETWIYERQGDSWVRVK